MAIIPAAGDLVSRGNQAVPLPLYSQVIGYGEDAFYGIVREDPPAVHSNKPLWKKSERDNVAHFLGEAQAEIEQVCGFPLNARWFADEFHDYGHILLTKKTKLIEVGIEATDVFGAGTAVGYVADPSIVGPVGTTVTDEDEIKVYHPGTTIEINPSSVTIALGFVTIEIPRARLLTEAGEAVTDGVDYTATGGPAGLFEQTVDVVRVFNDDSTQGELVWSHGTGTCAACSGSTDTACLTILNAEIGEMDVVPATYGSGAWTSKSWSCYCHCPDVVRVNYRAGLETLTAQARDAIIRLAHSKMPASPCNCDPPLYLWTRDQLTPQALTAERLNCPFGLNNGAWIAYQFARALKVVRGSTL